MPGADYGERGGAAALRSTTTFHPATGRPPFGARLPHEPPTTQQTLPGIKQEQSDFSSPSSSQAAPSSRSTTTTQDLGSGTLELPPRQIVARSELLRNAVFPDWRDGRGGDAMESPEEMQKKDPLGTQMWKLYSRTKSRLPNQERMENLTWRMMAMNLRRREQMLYAHHNSPQACPASLC